MMKKISYFLLTLALLPQQLFAQGADFGLEAARPSELPKTDLDNLAANLIQIVLGFVGIIFLVIIIWSGFQWMTSGGNEQKVTAAKNHMTAAAIGLIIIVAAYAITYYITSYVLEATQS